MQSKGSTFVLTGAGISAESGIPVFQGTSWRGRSHYDLASIEAWERDPALVWEYYSHRRGSARNARPNAAHIALAKWERSSPRERFFLCTQNVDGLHEAAESLQVAHIHGKLFESRCSGDCGRKPFSDQNSYDPANLPHCDCGCLIRPNVCWFGEEPYELSSIYQALDECRIFLAVGTSGSVQPVASFVSMLRRRPHPARTIYLGLEEPANAHHFDEVHLGVASQLVPEVIARLTAQASGS